MQPELFEVIPDTPVYLVGERNPWDFPVTHVCLTLEAVERFLKEKRPDIDHSAAMAELEKGAECIESPPEYDGRQRYFVRVKKLYK